MTEGFGALYITTGETADKAHFRLVIDTDTVERLSQRQQAVALYAYESVSHKPVTFFHSLQREGCVLRRHELEVTGSVRFVDMPSYAH